MKQKEKKNNRLVGDNHFSKIKNMSLLHPKSPNSAKIISSLLVKLEITCSLCCAQAPWITFTSHSLTEPRWCKAPNAAFKSSSRCSGAYNITNRRAGLANHRPPPTQKISFIRSSNPQLPSAETAMPPQKRPEVRRGWRCETSTTPPSSPPKRTPCPLGTPDPSAAKRRGEKKNKARPRLVKTKKELWYDASLIKS